jgi:hypothetical protein
VRDFDADLALLAQIAAFEDRQVADGVLAWRALGTPPATANR